MNPTDTSSDNGRRSVISTVGWAPPPGWLAWTHGKPPIAGHDEHGADDDTRRRIAAVRRFERLIDEDLPGTTCAALWFSDAPGHGPVASAVLQVFASAPTTVGSRHEAILERARTEIRVPPGVRVLDVAALPSAVTAGDAVLQIVDTTRRFGRRVSREWSWFILPPGTDDLVLVHIESSSIGHFDELADMSTDIANTVEVAMGPT